MTKKLGIEVAKETEMRATERGVNGLGSTGA